MSRRRDKKRSMRLRPGADREMMIQLTQIERMIKFGQLREAHEALGRLESRFSNRPEVYQGWADLYLATGDMSRYQHTLEQWAEAAPDDAEVHLALIGTYIQNAHPMLTLHAMRAFAERWPDHKETARLRRTIRTIEEESEQLFAGFDLPPGEREEFGRTHERLNAAATRGDLEAARPLAEELLARKPDFAPALNNLSLATYIQGNLDEAIQLSQRVLQIDPDNFHARSNLTRYLVLLGQRDAAKRHAAHLGEHPSTNTDYWTKYAEALYFAGDDQGVVESAQAALDAHKKQELSSLLFQLAGDSALRLGDEKTARRMWKEARDHLGREMSDTARANLAEMRKPLGERHAPWTYSLSSWMPRSWIGAILEQARQGRFAENDGAAEHALLDLLDTYPALEQMVPLLLERGDESARNFALLLGDSVRTPPIIEALRDFALSQHGTSQLRQRASQIASEEGAMPTPARIWLDGEWREVSLLNLEIHGDPVYEHSPEVEKLLDEGIQAMRAKDGKKAEQWFRRAVELEPDKPDVVQNLAASLELQGRTEEANAMALQNIANHPDYLHGRITMARYLLAKEQVDETHELLKELLNEPRFHHADYVFLCETWIMAFLAREDRDGAQHWLSMWEQVDPDHDKLPYWRKRLRASPQRRRR